MAREHETRQLTPPVAVHGEGAYWDAGRAAWLWVDMLAGRLMITDVGGRTWSHQLADAVAAAARPVDTGEVVVVGERALWLVDPSRATSREVLRLDLADGCRANEAALTPDGGLAVGTMASDATAGAGRVLVVAADGTVREALDGTTVSNGTVYREHDVLFVDSLTREIGAYVVDAARWVRSGTPVVIPSDDGYPDGICVDAEGAIWIAIWAGGTVQRWSPAGVLLDVVHVPVSQPTSVSLGGADRRTLLITTSAHELPPDHGTEAGALFAVRVDVPGVPEPALPRRSVDAWSAVRP